MNNLTVFKNDEFKEVRTLIINDEPWFVGKDVAENLGYAETANMRKLLDNVDYQEINPQKADIAGFVQNGRIESNPNIKRMLLINESGLYTAIIYSKLPEAKKFKRWITSEVLPSIRKTGQYQIGPIKSPSITEMIRLGKFIKGLMDDQKANPYQTAEAIMETLKNCGLNVSDKLSLPVKLEKLRDNELDMVDFATTFPKSTYQDYLLYRIIMMNSRGK